MLTPAVCLASLDEARWQHRIVIVEIASKDELAQHSQVITEHHQMFESRKLIVLLTGSQHMSVMPDTATTIKFNQSELKTRLGNNKAILIGLDGETKAEYDRLLFERVFNDIDAMPMRRAEMFKQKVFNE